MKTWRLFYKIKCLSLIMSILVLFKDDNFTANYYCGIFNHRNCGTGEPFSLKEHISHAHTLVYRSSKQIDSPLVALQRHIFKMSMKLQYNAHPNKIRYRNGRKLGENKSNTRENIQPCPDHEGFFLLIFCVIY